MVVTRIICDVTNHQKYREKNVPLSTYESDTHVYASAGLIPYGLMIIQTPGTSNLRFRANIILKKSLKSMGPIVLKGEIMQ